jgi:hypothetical protein
MSAPHDDPELARQPGSASRLAVSAWFDARRRSARLRPRTSHRRSAAVGSTRSRTGNRRRGAPQARAARAPAAARSATSLSNSPKRGRGWGDAGQPSSSAIVPGAALVAAYHGGEPTVSRSSWDAAHGPAPRSFRQPSVGRPAGTKSRPGPIISTVVRTVLFGPRPACFGHLFRRAAWSDPGFRTGLWRTHRWRYFVYGRRAGTELPSGRADPAWHERRADQRDPTRLRRRRHRDRGSPGLETLRRRGAPMKLRRFRPDRRRSSRDEFLGSSTGL